MKLEGRKTYRHKDNPDEKVFHDTFIEQFGNERSISQIIHSVDSKGDPLYYVDYSDQMNAVTIIQWLGSPVGQSFLRDCGFEKIKK